MASCFWLFIKLFNSLELYCNRLIINDLKVQIPRRSSRYILNDSLFSLWMCYGSFRYFHWEIWLQKVHYIGFRCFSIERSCYFLPDSRQLLIIINHAMDISWALDVILLCLPMGKCYFFCRWKTSQHCIWNYRLFLKLGSYLDASSFGLYSWRY